jgi:hypothetical protein
MNKLQSPSPQFFEPDGTPLSGGLVYVGSLGQNPETAPLAVYWDEALTQPAAQPLKTKGGHVVRAGTPASVYFAEDDHSITVKSSAGALLLYMGSVTGDSNIRADLASTAAGKGADLLGTKLDATGAVSRTQHESNDDLVSVADTGVVADGSTDDGAALANAISAADIRGGALVLGPHTHAGASRPSLKGVQLLGNKAITYDAGGGQGKAVANRRGRDSGQKVLGRAYLSRLWNILDFTISGATYANTFVMVGDSVTASYVGPLLQGLLAAVPGITTVTNNAISGTTIEQWRTGTGGYAGSGKSLADVLATNPDAMYIAFGINTAYYGGSPSDYANSLDLALTTIRAARDDTETSISVVLPPASRDGGAMGIEGGWKRDEYYVHSLRALVEPLVDKHKFCLYDQSVETPEAAGVGVGTNGTLWLDSVGVHPIMGNARFLAGQIFDAIIPWQLRAVPTHDGVADVTPSAGFTQAGTGENMRTVRRRDHVVSDGYVNMTTPAALTSGQSIATLGTIYRPTRYFWGVDLLLYAGGSSWERIRGEIDNSGVLKTSQASTISPQRVYFYAAWNAV